jgi:hypothetical protein
MKIFAKKYCKIVIPDAGPLISLYRGNALWLLEKLQMDIIVPDAVKYEFQARQVEKASPELHLQAQEITTYLKSIGVQYYATESSEKILETIFRMIPFRDALQNSLSDSERFQNSENIKALRRLIRHAGENSIFEVVNQLEDDSKISPDRPVMILYEDKRIIRLRLANISPLGTEHSKLIHLVGTRGFVRGMEKAGIIPSASSLLEAMSRPSPEGIIPNIIADNAINEDMPVDSGSFWGPHSPDGIADDGGDSGSPSP